MAENYIKSKIIDSEVAEHLNFADAVADIHRKNGYDIEAEQALGYAKEIEEKIKK